MDKEQKVFEEYALNEGINIGKVHGQYFYNETKMALKDFSAGWQARAALDMSEELAEALEAIKRHQEMNVKSNTAALMGTTWYIAEKALNKYRERKI